MAASSSGGAASSSGGASSFSQALPQLATETPRLGGVTPVAKPSPPAMLGPKHTVLIGTCGQNCREISDGDIVVNLSQLGRKYNFRNRPEDGRKCSGLDDALRAQVASSAQFQRILAQVVDTILNILQEKTTVKVLIFCNWGKHRSVSMAVELEGHLLEMLPVDQSYIAVWHFERPSWDHVFRQQRQQPPFHIRDWKERHVRHFKASRYDD